MTAERRHLAHLDLEDARKHLSSVRRAPAPDPEYADAHEANAEDSHAEHERAVLQLYLAQRP